GSSATTTATGSPTYRTRPWASTGWRYGSRSMPSKVIRSGMGSTCATSSPVKTACTPRIAWACETSTPTMCPCETVERTTRIQTWPGRSTSSTNRPVPCSNRLSSRRSTRSPTCLDARSTAPTLTSPRATPRIRPPVLTQRPSGVREPSRICVLEPDSSVADTTFTTTAPPVVVLRNGEPLDIVSGGVARALAWPGMGSQQRAMHCIGLEPGGATIELRHPSEATYVVARGSGRVGELRVETPSIVYVPRGEPYRFTADEAMTIYGGPCPPDLSLYGVPERATLDGEGEGRVRVLDPESEGVPLPMISRHARLVVWPGSGADI